MFDLADRLLDAPEHQRLRPCLEVLAGRLRSSPRWLASAALGAHDGLLVVTDRQLLFCVSQTRATTAEPLSEIRRCVLRGPDEVEVVFRDGARVLFHGFRHHLAQQFVSVIERVPNAPRNPTLTRQVRERRSPRVGGWGWAILFFGWIGGLIGYLAVRADDPRRANHIMKWGVIASLLSVLLWFGALAALLSVAASIRPSPSSQSVSGVQNTAGGQEVQSPNPTLSTSALTADQQAHAISMSQFDSIALGTSETAVVSNLAKPPQDPQDYVINGVLKQADIKASCLFYNNIGAAFGAGFQFCFSSNRLINKTPF